MLNDLNSSPNIVWVIKSRIMRCVGHVACIGERKSIYRVLVEKAEQKIPLGRPRHSGECNIKMDLNPLPLIFKALLHGQKDCIFSAGI
jgi:hypothetical protein